MNTLVLNASGTENYALTLQALSAALDPSTDRVERHRADTFLSQLRSSNECFPIILRILTEDSSHHTDGIRLLSLTIVNVWIRENWNKISESLQATVRNEIIKMVTTTVGNSSVKGLRTKLAVMISNIAELQYPQHWPTFLDEMVAIWRIGTPEQQEIAIMAIEATAVDCIDTDYNNKIPSNRRNDIITGFRHQITPLLDVSLSFLNQMVNAVCNEDQSKLIDSPASNLANATLRMMIPIFSFARPEDLYRQNCDFILAITSITSLPTLQQEGINCLAAIAQHKYTLELLLYLLEQINNNVLTYLPPEVDDSIAIQRVYADSIFTVMINNFTLATSAEFLMMSNRKGEEVLSRYVSVMLKMIEQPSRRLAADVVSTWMKLFKETDIATRLPWMCDVSLQVLKVYTVKIKRVVLDSDEYPINGIEAAEYDDASEWVEFFNSLRVSTRQLAQTVTHVMPTVACRFAHETIQLLLQTCSIPTDQLSKQLTGHSTKDTTAYVEWDAASVMLDAIAQSLRISGITQECVDMMHRVVQLLLDWNITYRCHLLGSIRLKCIESAAVFIGTSQTLLYSTLPAVMDSLQLQYPCNGINNEHINATFTVKAKAATCIARLCDACGSAIVASTMLNDFVGAIVNILSEESRDDATISTAIKTHLREALVFLANKVVDPTQKQELIFLALKDVVSIIISPQIAAFFASPMTVLTAITKSETDFAQGGDSHIELKEFRRAISTVYTVGRQIESIKLSNDVWKSPSYTYSIDTLKDTFAFTSVWTVVLPTLINVIASIHGIWDPKLRIPVVSSSTIDCDMSVLYQPIGINGNTLGDNQSNQSTGDSVIGSSMMTKHVKVAGNYLNEIRSFLYQMFGRAAIHKVLYVIPEYHSLLGNISSSISWFENSHVTMIITYFFEHLVLHAPAFVYQSIAGFCSAFMPHILTRLSVAWDMGGGHPGDQQFLWNVYRECSVPKGFNNMNDEQVESTREKIIAGLTRSYSESLSCFGCCRGLLAIKAVATTDKEGKQSSSGWAVNDTQWFKTSKDKTVEEQNEDERQIRCSSLNVLFRSNQFEHTSQSFIDSVIALLSIPDSVTVQRSVQLVDSLISQPTIDARMICPIGNDAFRYCVFIILRDEKWSAGLEWEIIELIHKIYCRFVLGLDISSNIIQAAGVTICDLPRTNLLQLPSVMTARITSLEQQLISCASKKRKREIFKDFLTEIIDINRPRKEGEISALFAESTLAKITSKLKIHDTKHKVKHDLDLSDSIFTDL